MNKYAIGLVCVACLLANGCGSDDAVDVPQELASLAGCSADGIATLEGLVESLLSLVDAIQDPMNPPPGVTFTPTGETTANYSIDVDTDDDGFPDMTVGGSLDTTGDLSDGFDPGEVLSVNWTSGPLLTGDILPGGSGNFQFTASDVALIDLTGAGQVLLGGCLFEYTDTAVTLDLTVPGDLTATGNVFFTVTSGLDSMNGTMTFLTDGTIVVGASYLGEDYSFEIDTDTGGVEFF